MERVRMNDYLVSFLLGIVEGLTEFVPVSSTAHLRITEALLNVSLSSGYWKMYSIVIQLGAVLCLPVYFSKRISKFLSAFPRGENGDRTILTHPLSLTCLAFVVTAIPTFFLTKVIGKNLESLTIMGSSLVVGGILMWVIDRLNSRAEAEGEKGTTGRIDTWHMEAMRPWQAVWIGVCQIFSAVFPGTSRSMATIAAGQVAGMSRAAALEFSFFLSIPTMVAATGYDLLKAVTGKGEHATGIGQMTTHEWLVLAIGFVVSFIVAYAVVAWLLAWVRTHGFVPFAIYRLVLGAAVWAWGLLG
jgi:undecaprenyl-diphosphatase